MLNMTGLDKPARNKLADDYYAWEHAKWTFKTTLIVDIVVVKHLVEPHLLVAGPLATESKMLLRPDHWMRRFLRPLTFRSTTINDAAVNTLLAEYGSVQRQTSLAQIDGLKDAVLGAADAYRFLSFADWVATKKMTVAETESLPLVKDGRRLWKIYETFVTKLVSAFVPSDASEWAPEDRGAIDRFFKAINTKYHDPDGVMGRRLQEGEPGKYRDDATPPHPRSHYGIPELVGVEDSTPRTRKSCSSTTGTIRKPSPASSPTPSLRSRPGTRCSGTPTSTRTFAAPTRGSTAMSR